MSRLAVAIVLATAGVASAQVARDSTTALRDANAAASAGDWVRVAQLVDPLFNQPLSKIELGEAHRLAGLAAFSQQRTTDAEAHFAAYLRTDLDATLDPALYPPDVVTFFLEVRKRHEVELRALRPSTHRHIWLNIFPTVGQLQNGERTKGIVLGTMLGVFIVGNVVSYGVLHSWCTQTANNGRTGATCDDSSDHFHAAQQLRQLNWVTGGAAIATYLYGVYDGVQHYRQHSRELILQPYIATPSGGGSVLGISGNF